MKYLNYDNVTSVIGNGHKHAVRPHERKSMANSGKDNLFENKGSIWHGYLVSMKRTEIMSTCKTIFIWSYCLFKM